MSKLPVKKTKILFVCLGNICRSPSAHTIFQHMIDKKGISEKYEIDSAGILSVHEGEMADARMRKHAEKRGYFITTRSRPVEPVADFEYYDMIIGMDNNNIRNLRSMTIVDEKLAKISKMTDYCTLFKETEIPDPYYGGFEGFEYVLDLLEDACNGLLLELEEV
ncbi:MAG: low molecular weight protein-tyrosine-phosphatase [Bacteroidales bacterium]